MYKKTYESTSNRIYESVTDGEFKLITSKIKNKKIIVALYLAYKSGLRISEILNLQKNDFKLDERKIFVRQGKGGKDRITICPKYFKKEWLELFPLQISKMGIQKAFLNASIKSGVNQIIYEFKTKNKKRNKYRLHFHCLRHSFATDLLESGVPINQLQLFLGHSNVATTNQYIKSNPTNAIKNIIDMGL